MLVLAGHNGAGKTTCYDFFLKGALEQHVPLHINADAIEKARKDEPGAQQLSADDASRTAKEEADAFRWRYLDENLPFSMETVFSDPVGAKLLFLREARRRGYVVALVAIGLDSPELSMARVALRVQRGGHDVPKDRLVSRYPRVLENFRQALPEVSIAIVVDNSEDAEDDDPAAYEPLAIFIDGKLVHASQEAPEWWLTLQPKIQQRT